MASGKLISDSDSGSVEIALVNDADRKPTEVKITYFSSSLERFYDELAFTLWRKFEKQYGVEPILPKTGKPKYTTYEAQIGQMIKKDYRKRGPNVNTQERFKIMDRIKREHPTWTRQRVANKYNDTTGENIGSDTVRNTYRKMGEKWERGDRVR